jgi:hypothetical protein
MIFLKHEKYLKAFFLDKNRIDEFYEIHQNKICEVHEIILGPFQKLDSVLGKWGKYIENFNVIQINVQIYFENFSQQKYKMKLA